MSPVGQRKLIVYFQNLSKSALQGSCFICPSTSFVALIFKPHLGHLYLIVLDVVPGVSVVPVAPDVPIFPTYTKLK